MGTFQHIQRENEQHSQTLIRPALEIGKEDDEHEKEADNVADKVMRMTDKDEDKDKKMTESPAVLQKMSESPAVMAKMSTPDEDEKVQKMSESSFSIQKKAGSLTGGMAASENVEQGINSSKGNSQSLPADTQKELGGKMNADFSDVSIHTDNKAVEMSNEVGAKAFTHGNDIYFNRGQYDTSSSQGKHLLAHELTHTVQQGGNRIHKKIIQRDIVDSGPDMKSDEGQFSINLVKKEIPPESKVGEKGTVGFHPDKKSFKTNEIGMIQIVKNTKIDNAGIEADYADWQGDDADINSVKTSEKLIVYNTTIKDTLKTISQSQTNGHVTPLEIYNVNMTALGAFDENKAIPDKTEIKIPKVQANYSIDIPPKDPKATKRTKARDAEVPLFYRDYQPNPLDSKDGYNKTNTMEASLWDFPGIKSAAVNYRWDFETVARSKDKGFDYGTVHWGFTADHGIIKNEYHYLAKGTSSTYNSAIAEFNEFYANHHLVVKGDTLYNIAERYLGDGKKWKEIQIANKMKDGSIKIGDKLIIPKITATAP